MDITLKVNLNALVTNYQLIQKKVGKSQVASVVKANAYGLGVQEVARALAQSGCQKFFVATIEEGIELRKILPKAWIGVFHGLWQKAQAKLYRQYQLIPVVNHLEASCWVEDLPCVIQVDTGMTRLGLNTAELEHLPDGLQIEYLMTHPACADEPAHPLNKEQHQLFKTLSIKGQKNLKKSYANSYAIFADKKNHFDLVRPGCSLYGINPLPGQMNPMKSVVTLTSKVIQIHTLTKSQSVGYGATYQAPKGEILATIVCGYADGYMRSTAGRVWCVIHGQKVPVVGRVSMDLIVVDISSISAKVQLGDEVTLLGEGISLDEFADCAGTIAYEILVRLGSRATRIY